MSNQLVDSICKTCQNNVNRIAVVDEKKRMTYSEVFSKAKGICSFLEDKVHSGDVVGIYMDKSVDYIVLIVALILYGCIYVPIDKRNLKERLNYIVSESGCKLIVTDESEIDCDLCETCNFNDIQCISGEDYCITKSADMKSEVYILFTSGSTGNPKGVRISYENLWNLISSLNQKIYAKQEKKLKIAVLASFSFDASVKQIFCSLIYGHSLYIVNDQVKRFGRLLCNYYIKYKIDVCDFTPSLITVISKDKRCKSYFGLKILLVGGELLLGKHIKCIRRIFGNKVDVVNVYGPTECCVDVCFYNVPQDAVYRDEEIIPVGKPLKNNYISLNENQEIVVQGANVGLGYTTEQYDSGFGFFDGVWGYNTRDIGTFDEKNQLVVLGRSDNQVKINGHRIELEDIENNIYALQDVDFVKVFIYERCIVAVICSSVKSQAYYVKHLKQKLPSYMMPDVFIFDDDLKLNKNMKFDSKYYTRLL